MNKQVITFSANEQSLIKTGGINNYASNIVSYVEAQFDLGANWQGYDSIRAIWHTQYTDVATVLDTEGICIVPAEVLNTKARLTVNLVGSISENDVLTDRLTTYPIEALIVDADARITAGASQPITPSEYEQFVASVKADADRAEDAKDSARGYAESASASAESASASASGASASAVSASLSAQIAEDAKTIAQASANSASASAESAEEWADKAEQSAEDAGYMELHIDENGHLIFERTSNVDQIDFSLVNGHLILEVA